MQQNTQSQLVSIYKDNAYDEKYILFYKDLIKCTDEIIIDWWKYFQKYTIKQNDLFFIGSMVCEDILRQRGNTYVDDNFNR